MVVCIQENTLQWEELRHNDLPALQIQLHTASMAGDSETHIRDRGENNSVIRQPFLIGVSGGTASGKVGILASIFHDFYELSRVDFKMNHGGVSVGSRLLVDRVASATHRSDLIDSLVIC